ncbi:MAG: L-arabinose isomerase [Oscillospiraceae bacterium]|nr:L-arabinose isomerase [Oscillospiraceae bacterium]
MKFWFITGAQELYGEETLRLVAKDSRTIVRGLNDCGRLPYEIKFTAPVTSDRAITKLMQSANADPDCGGVITWMHTFSPSKMWIEGLQILEKPYLHLHTQCNREIPWDAIDMDFMNLNQSAHGDREHGFIAARLRKPRVIAAGYWQDEDTQKKIADFMAAAAGVIESRGVRCARFGDNMREVAVTEGDKIEAQMRMGWHVNSWGVGDLADMAAEIKKADVEAAYADAVSRYELATDDVAEVKNQLRVKLALEGFMKSEGINAFVTAFQDLHGLKSLPGMASQMLMEEGYGFGAEGDWKTACLCRVMKVMAAAKGTAGGTGFMEDYTYDLTKGSEAVLGAHMLEVCPTLAAGKPRIEVHPLSIGGKEPPARLVFESGESDAVNVTVIDIGGRLRMIVQEISTIAPIHHMPNLPVAATMWRTKPDHSSAAEMWIKCGGAHHFVISQQLTYADMKRFADLMGIECVRIGDGVCMESLSQTLMINEIAYKLGI